MAALTVGVVGHERESRDRSKTGSWRIIELSFGLDSIVRWWGVENLGRDLGSDKII